MEQEGAEQLHAQYKAVPMDLAAKVSYCQT